jgi:hypothetical protein
MQTEEKPLSRREGLIAAAMFAVFASFALFTVLTEGGGRLMSLLMFLVLSAAGGLHALRAFFPHLYSSPQDNENLGVRLCAMGLIFVFLGAIAALFSLAALNAGPWPMRILWAAGALVCFGYASFIVVQASAMVMRRLKKAPDQ